MKNAKKLLLAAAFISIAPSAKLLCEDEPIESNVTEVVSNEITAPETITIQHKIAAAINNTTTTIAKNKYFLMGLSANLGTIGLIAGTGAFCALKKQQKDLRWDFDFQPSDPKKLKSLNKNIKNSKLLIAASFAAKLPAYIAYTHIVNELHNHNKENTNGCPYLP